MLRKLTFALTLLVLVPALLFAQDGKLRGTVTDRETGEPLVGANVVVDGTNLGASTDLNGEYVILSVPPGTYSLKATYIGYSTFTISNVRVSSNLTTSQDFQLASSAIQVEAVEVVAERPLIQKNTTNTVRVTTQEDIKNLPIRGVQALVTLSAGVVNQGGTLYVRGGRAGEVAYFVDGASITNPYYNAQSQPLIQEALEEIQLQTGGYTAEFGNANSGIIRTTTRTGGQRFNFSLDYRTDDFSKPGDTFLGTTSRGYKNAVGTIGGPIINGIRFFLAGQNNYARTAQSIFLEPFHFEGMTDDGFQGGSATRGRLLVAPDTAQNGIIDIKRNYLAKNWTNNYSFNGNVLFDLEQLASIPLKFRVLGTYGFTNTPGSGGWPGGFANYFRSEDRTYTNETTQWMVAGRLTHVLSNTTFYEIGVSYQYRFAETYDANYGHSNFNEYLEIPDSAAAAARGFNTAEWQGRYTGPFTQSTIFNFQFTHPEAPNNGYFKNEQAGLGLTLDLTSQVTSNWEVKAGGQLDSWTSRLYNFNNIRNLLNYLDPNRDGNLADAPVFGSDYEKRVRYMDQGNIVTWGYDYLGTKSDGYTLAGSSATLDPPYEPLTAAAYVQTKYEYKDLILNLGARYEYYDAKFKAATSKPNPVTGELDYTDIEYDYNLGIIDETKIVESDPISYVLPRVSFSFPVSDMTVFYAQYGKFTQMPSLSTFYTSSYGFSQQVAPPDRSPYSFGAGASFQVLPERTTLFEAGIRQILTDNLAFTLTGFYRDTRQQIQVRPYYNSQGQRLFTSYQNVDFGTIKGLEMTLDLRRTNRLSARLNYTLSDAKGTGNTATSNYVAVTDETRARTPEFIVRMPFNQTHVGSVILDYRFAKGDGGPVLEGMGLNLIFSFNSGHNYTKLREPQNLGQATPWNVGVRQLIDARTSNPVEPVSASVTPWVFDMAMNFNKVFYIGDFNLEVYVNVLNLLNIKEVVNVFPTTGTAQDDGWLKSPFATSYKTIPNYESFYRAVNLQNRWALIPWGGDTYGSPREIRVGLKLEY